MYAGTKIWPLRVAGDDEHAVLVRRGDGRLLRGDALGAGATHDEDVGAGLRAAGSCRAVRGGQVAVVDAVDEAQRSA